MQIFHSDTDLTHVLREIFRHTLCQRGDQYLMMIRCLLIHFSDQIIDLSLNRANRDFRIKQSGRPDDLLHTHQFVLLLIHIRCRRNEKHLIDLTLKFFEVQRTVVQSGRQTKSVIHQRLLTRTVARIHAADLRNRNMRLIHDQQEIIREEINECHRRLPRLREIQMSRIILNSRAETGLTHHLDIKIRPLRDALRLDQLIVLLKIFHTIL